MVKASQEFTKVILTEMAELSRALSTNLKEEKAALKEEAKTTKKRIDEVKGKIDDLEFELEDLRSELENLEDLNSHSEVSNEYERVRILLKDKLEYLGFICTSYQINIPTKLHKAVKSQVDV